MPHSSGGAATSTVAPPVCSLHLSTVPRFPQEGGQNERLSGTTKSFWILTFSFSSFSTILKGSVSIKHRTFFIPAPFSSLLPPLPTCPQVSSLHAESSCSAVSWLAAFLYSETWINLGHYLTESQVTGEHFLFPGYMMYISRHIFVHLAHIIQVTQFALFKMLTWPMAGLGHSISYSYWLLWINRSCNEVPEAWHVQNEETGLWASHIACVWGVYVCVCGWRYVLSQTSWFHEEGHELACPSCPSPSPQGRSAFAWGWVWDKELGLCTLSPSSFPLSSGFVCLLRAVHSLLHTMAGQGHSAPPFPLSPMAGVGCGAEAWRVNPILRLDIR